MFITRTVNAYFAVLLITAAGALAAWVIVRVAYRNQYTVVSANSEAGYASLEQSILQGTK